MNLDSFSIYLQLGFEHIADLAGYDHILFIIALCVIYRLAQWRHVLILVTAFTIGHSITLALAAFDVIKISVPLIEFLIPVTIVITCLFNVTQRAMQPKKIRLNYAMTLFFGLIHGLGFSNQFKMLLSQEQSIVDLLLPFNIGIELGQLVIVVLIMLMSFVFLDLFKVKHREWNLFVSGAAAGVAMLMALERIGAIL